MRDLARRVPPVTRYALANNTPYGLSAYFYSDDRVRCYRAAQRLEAGSVWINDIHRSYLQAPYGGMKQSGIEHEQGATAIDEIPEVKHGVQGYERQRPRRVRVRAPITRRGNQKCQPICLELMFQRPQRKRC